MGFFLLLVLGFFFHLPVEFGRDGPAVAISQCWGVALQDGAKSC